MHKLLIATSNPGKIREFKQLFADLEQVQLVTPAEIGGISQVVEDGDSFAHNACKKAHEVAAATGVAVLSDDCPRCKLASRWLARGQAGALVE